MLKLSCRIRKKNLSKRRQKCKIGILTAIRHCTRITHTQVFDNTAVARDGTLEAGDEIVGVGGESVKGRSKVEVAKMIQVGIIISSFPDLSTMAP